MVLFAKGILNSAKFLEDDDFPTLQRFLGKGIPQSRREKWKHKRMDWQAELVKLQYIRGFQTRYRLSEDSFNKLVDILRPQVTVNMIQSKRSTSGNDSITPEIVVAVGLRYLAGEKKISLSDIFGISRFSVQRIINKFLDAVDSNTRLQIQHPTTL